jgi:hypothetical protein
MSEQINQRMHAARFRVYRNELAGIDEGFGVRLTVYKSELAKLLDLLSTRFVTNRAVNCVKITFPITRPWHAPKP